MEAMGAPFVEVIPYALDPATLQATASQAISKLKAAGVTTIVFSGDPVAPRDFTNEATAQEYFPEWFISASTLVDISAFAGRTTRSSGSTRSASRQLAARVNPGEQGYRFLYEWFNGDEPSVGGHDRRRAAEPGAVLRDRAGGRPEPHPRDVAGRAVRLPGTEQAISQPYLTYGDKGYWPEPDYQGIDDTTILWWDPTATGPDEIQREGTGMYQFVDGGKRYLPGEWPTEEKLFDPGGRGDVLRDAAARRGAEAVPQPRRLTLVVRLRPASLADRPVEGVPAGRDERRVGAAERAGCRRTRCARSAVTGCADSITTWRSRSMSAFFLRANAPHRMNTTRSCFAFTARSTSSVNVSQPLPECEPACPARTVRQAFSSSTPCFAHDSRLPCGGASMPRSSCSSLRMLTSDGGGATPRRTEKHRPCAWLRAVVRVLAEDDDLGVGVRREVQRAEHLVGAAGRPSARARSAATNRCSSAQYGLSSSRAAPGSSPWSAPAHDRRPLLLSCDFSSFM